MKIAIVTDSNSGITQKQAQELGVFVLAMPFQIDGETYYEDITLTQEEFYKKLREGGNISTSQPSPGSVTDLWDKFCRNMTRSFISRCQVDFPAPARLQLCWLRKKSMMERSM